MVAERLFQQAKLLIENPYLGIKVEIRNDEKVRELISGNYRVVYFIADNEDVLIYLVVHSSMDFNNLPRIKKLYNEQK